MKYILRDRSNRGNMNVVEIVLRDSIFLGMELMSQKTQLSSGNFSIYLTNNAILHEFDFFL